MLSKPGIEGNFLSLIKGIYEKPGLPRWLSGKEATCQYRRHRDRGLIPGSGRSPGAGNGNPLQYSPGKLHG